MLWHAHADIWACAECFKANSFLFTDEVPAEILEVKRPPPPHRAQHSLARHRSTLVLLACCFISPLYLATY